METTFSFRNWLEDLNAAPAAPVAPANAAATPTTGNPQQKKPINPVLKKAMLDAATKTPKGQDIQTAMKNAAVATAQTGAATPADVANALSQ